MPPTAPDTAKSAGFTLIETLVALVILAAVLLAFYQFLASALNAAAATQRAAAAYDRQQNALALATTLNPMETPEGIFDLGLYRIRWSAEAIGPVRRISGFSSGKGWFTIGLYRVIFDFPGEPLFPSVAVTKLGYHREAAPYKTSGDAVN